MVRKLIATQDDCAPDAREYFFKEVKKKTGKTFLEWKKESVFEHSEDGMTTTKTIGRFQLEISGDDPYYKLYELVEDEEIKPAVCVPVPERACFNCFAAFVCRYNRRDDHWAIFPAIGPREHNKLLREIVRSQAKACRYYKAREGC